MNQIESRRQAAVSLSKLKTERMFGRLPDLVRQIPNMTEAQLLQMFRCADQLADFAFLMRGACASELRKRSGKLPGGRGKRDAAGTGIQAQMEELARKVGTGRKTLETDARIKDTFFPVIDETTLEQMPPLAREYYVIALSAPDPVGAIKSAIERCSESDFTLRRFRLEVRILKTSRAAPGTIVSAEHLFAFKAWVSPEVSGLISDLTTKTGMTKDEIVAEAIRMLHASLSKPSDHMTRVSKSTKPGSHIHDDKQLELKM